MTERAPKPKQESKEPPNYHDLGRQRAWLRHSVEDLGASSAELLKRLRQGENTDEVWAEAGPAARALRPSFEKELKQLDKAIAPFSIEDQGGLREAANLVRAQKAEAAAAGWLDTKKIEAEMDPAYIEIEINRQKSEELTDFILRRAREAHWNPFAAKAQAPLIAAARQELRQTQTEQEAAQLKHPDEARAVELTGYMRGLHEEGHIAVTPGVSGYLEEIGKRMVAGKPMFLHGPTGTGKTSLARLAAKRFSGEAAEMVYCNPQTREANIWGKTGIRPTTGGAIETVDIYGPLAKAMRDGKVVIFDEFTALPREQMVFIKGIMNAKPGDTVNIMGNGQIKIAAGFQMIFTANLKSEKNPERQEMPPEIAREFEQNNLKVAYSPAEEAYDIMLARLANPDGSLNISAYDLNITLPKLCEALAEIQKAYEGQVDDNVASLIGVKDASGKVPGLKKFVTTQGTIESILDGWKTGADSQTFAAYLDQRLKVGLTFEEYPEADRKLAAKILASKGLLKTLTPADLRLPNEVFEIQAIKQGRGEEAKQELIQRSAKVTRLSIKDVARLDPFGRRAASLKNLADGFLPEEDAGEEAGESADLNEVREILGAEHVLGPEEIKKAFNIELKNVPAIPFSKEILEACKGQNIDLILFTDKLADGSPLTGNNLVAFLNNKKNNGQPLIYGDSIKWLTAKDATGAFKEPCFAQETPQLQWKLVSREVLDQSKNMNYLNQTQVLVEQAQALYAKASLSMPAQIRQALDEFDQERASIERIISSQWQQAVDKLEALQANQLLRETLVESIYRLTLIDRAQNQLIQSNTYSWTKARSSDRSLVGFGRSGDADGADALRWRPDFRNPGIGCAFSAANL